ncbi:unnamed protein product [Cylindrotheca closterium]|uniref:Calmodulin-lysine N-methyltransferase n=1 Tax=Cylindrotheca closterium TaxID=2856 RepID=A0AAD2GBF7_9STRA|nr:unnamed protein product [Cylindrotheca closterium]
MSSIQHQQQQEEEEEELNMYSETVTITSNKNQLNDEVDDTNTADDDSSSSSDDDDDDDEFDFIESKWENMVETGVVVNWPGSSRALTISTKLEEDNIAPLFNGTQWAGTRVWKAAVLAVEYLWEHHRHTTDGDKSMLELGCGLGVPGMVWHLLHKEQNKVVLTDQPSLVSQLQENVEHNFPASSEANTNTNNNNNNNNTKKKKNMIQAKPLSWSKEGLTKLLEECDGDGEDKFDICLNCDCVYEPLYGRDSWEALADILGVMAKASPNTLLVTSVERRNGDGLENFIERLEATGNVEPMKQVLRNADDKHHVIEIYITRGKSNRSISS